MEDSKRKVIIGKFVNFSRKAVSRAKVLIKIQHFISAFIDLLETYMKDYILKYSRIIRNKFGKLYDPKIYTHSVRGRSLIM